MTDATALRSCDKYLKVDISYNIDNVTESSLMKIQATQITIPVFYVRCRSARIYMSHIYHSYLYEE
jgi:hypothetical protein